MDSAKKQALQRILEALIPYWDLAEWFLLLLKESKEESLYDEILNMVYKWVKSIKSIKERDKIRKKIIELHNKYDYEEKKDEEIAEKILNEFIDQI